MTRSELFRQMVENATRPVECFDAEAAASAPCVERQQELYVWFEDTSGRRTESRIGIAGLPESLFPVASQTRVLERHYVPGHPHLLTAVRVLCRDRASERIAAIYTAALSVGTVAWIGTGSQYQIAWNALYTTTEDGFDFA